MDSGLKEELVVAMHRIRRLSMSFMSGNEIHMGELAVMNAIAGCPRCPRKRIFVSEIQNHAHHMTKPAVSQILNTLEKKGYVSREMDAIDRRKIAVSLTPSGQEILKRQREDFDRKLEAVISRFGEDNTRQLTKLFTLLADAANDMVREETLLAEKKGDNQGD